MLQLGRAAKVMPGFVGERHRETSPPNGPMSDETAVDENAVPSIQSNGLRIHSRDRWSCLVKDVRKRFTEALKQRRDSPARPRCGFRPKQMMRYGIIKDWHWLNVHLEDAMLED